MTDNTLIQRTDAYMASLGVEAYRVGGSVRDEILGRRVKDADYMVRGVGLADLFRAVKRADSGSAVKPMQDRAGRPLGVRVSKKGLGLIEITLPRVEVSTGPGHRDFDIVLEPTLPLHEDAKRRDFTFNALYKPVGHDGAIADPTSAGLYDLQHKLVRTTHADSFRDDPLRVLRALRFVSTLGYDLTSDTLLQMTEHHDAVSGLKESGHLSGTVLDEMSRLLMGDSVAKALRVAASTGVLGTLFPELAPMIGFDQGSRYHDMTTDEHTFMALETAARVEAPLRVRWSLLFHDSGKPETAWVGDDGRKHYYARDPKDGVIDPASGRLNLDHEEQSEYLWLQAAVRMNVPSRLRQEVATMVRNHMVQCSGKVKGSKVRRDRVKFGDSLLRDLHMHRMCDLSAKGKANRAHLIHVAEREDLRRLAMATGVPSGVKDLAVGGRDAMEHGLQGSDIGKALAAVLDEVVTQPNDTKLTREWQLERLWRAV